VVAVNGCTFDVSQGSITGLIGPNGAGKTTLFNVISGFMAPNEGQILLNDVDVAGEKPNDLFQRGLVLTFQIPHEFQRMTVLENLMVVPKEQQG
jgi:branched-chain amino acid transport system ATP-binding protein